MTRFLTAAAMALLIATPALAQNAGTSSQPYGSNPQSPPAATSENPQGGAPGAANIPANCTPNDTRPECQTAQLPGSQQQQPQQPGTENQPQQQEQQPGTMGAPQNPNQSQVPGESGGSSNPPSGSSGSSSGGSGGGDE